MSTNILIIDPKDNVGVALRQMSRGESFEAITPEGDRAVECVDEIPLGHKVALKDLPKGEWIIKYGLPIGRTKLPIRQGEHVHVHNVQDCTEELVQERRG